MNVKAQNILGALAAFVLGGPVCSAALPDSFVWDIWQCGVNHDNNSAALFPDWDRLAELADLPSSASGVTITIPGYVYCLDPDTHQEVQLPVRTVFFGGTPIVNGEYDFDLWDRLPMDVTVATTDPIELTFSGNEGLRKLYFYTAGEPNVTFFGEDVFRDCRNLEQISTFDMWQDKWITDVFSPAWKSVPSVPFRDCPKLTGTATLWPWLEFGNLPLAGIEVSKVVVPAERATIPREFFSESSVEYLHIEDGDDLLTLEGSILSDQVKFFYLGRTFDVSGGNSRDLYLPAMMTMTLGCVEYNGRLSHPEALRTVRIMPRVKKLAEYSFSANSQTINKGCINLELVDIVDYRDSDNENDHSSLEAIPQGCFSNCSALRHIQIPQSVKSVGFDAFSGCSSLTLSLPGTVEEISHGAFSDLGALYMYPGEKPLKQLKGFSSGWSSCSADFVYVSRELASDWDKTLFTNVENLCVGDIGVKMNDRYTWNVKNVFFNEDEESIFAPCKVETLGRYAFENLKMKNLIMPKSLKHVEGALSSYDESEIEMIEFGPVLETISDDCFYRLNRLNTIVVQAEVPPALALDRENWWDGFDPEGIMLSVPSRSWQVYSEAPGWKEFFAGCNSLDISVAGVDKPICYFVNVPASRDASDEEPLQKIYVRDGYSMGLQSGKTLTLGFDIPEGRTLARLELNGMDMLPAVRDNKVAITLQGDSRLEMALDGAAAVETLATGGDESEVMARYDLTGRPVGASASGVIIEKSADGRVRKVVK